MKITVTPSKKYSPITSLRQAIEAVFAGVSAMRSAESFHEILSNTTLDSGKEVEVSTFLGDLKIIDFRDDNLAYGKGVEPLPEGLEDWLDQVELGLTTEPFTFELEIK